MSTETLTTYTIECTPPDGERLTLRVRGATEPQAIAGAYDYLARQWDRDTARLVRRARSIQRHHAATTNERARCCPAPEHVERRDDGRLTTECRNCGAVV